MPQKFLIFFPRFAHFQVDHSLKRPEGILENVIKANEKFQVKNAETVNKNAHDEILKFYKTDSAFNFRIPPISTMREFLASEAQLQTYFFKDLVPY